MHKIVFVAASVLGALVAVSPSAAQSTPSSEDPRNSVVLVFKDGHRKSFLMSEVARIEFPTGATTTVSSAGQGRFLGEWRVGDCAGGYFKITLDREGVARKDLGAPHGTWLVVDGEARITWEDGNRDTIRRAGDTYEKAWYAPDRSYAEDASCTASAVSTDRKPI